MTPQGPAKDAVVMATQPSASTRPSPRRPRRGRWRLWLAILGLSCFTALVFSVALVVLAPVSVIARGVTIPSQIEGLYGSIWQGRVALAGGYRLTWETRAGALITGRLDMPFTLAGDDTQLNGTLRIGFGGVTFMDLSGRAGRGLLALADGMPDIACTAHGVVDVQRLFASRDLLQGGAGKVAAQGSVAIAAGACTETNGRVTQVPAMDLALTTDGADALAVLTAGDTLFLTLTLRGSRRIALRIEQDGAALVPGLPTGGPIELDYPF